MDNKQKPKFLLTGEKDIDDVIPVIEFSNMKNDDRAICVKLCKEIMKEVNDSHMSYFKKLSKKVKGKLEEEFQGSWNVIIGSEYGAYCSFERSYLLYFRLNQIYFLLYRFG